MHLRRRHFCCLPLVPAASLLTLSARAQDVMTATVEDQIWRDEARQRNVPVRLRWPAQCAPERQAGLPVLLFSHGLGGMRAGGSVWGDAWAQAGFAVVHHAAIGPSALTGGAHLMNDLAARARFARPSMLAAGDVWQTG